MSKFPNMRRWSAEKLDKELAFLRDDDPAQGEWRPAVRAEAARRALTPTERRRIRESAQSDDAMLLAEAEDAYAAALDELEEWGSPRPAESYLPGSVAQ